MNKTHRFITEAFIIATILTFFMASLTSIGFNKDINWLEVSAVYFSFACTWLCTRQVRFSYVLAVISTVLLSITFWQAELFGSMALNIYLIPTVIYGWFIWGKDEVTKPVEHVKLKILPVYLIVTTLTWLGAFLVIKMLDGALPVFDGWILVGSIFAQYLLDRKKIETWFIWIIVNVISIFVYLNSGLYLLAIQFGFFIINAVIGWIFWHRTLERVENHE
jgi:nicotinamide mononucleotide transporter